MSRVIALNRTLLLCRDFLSVKEATDDEIVRALSGATVTIIADADDLATGAAQSAVVGLAGQVLAYGCRLHLAIPNVPIIGSQPPLLGTLLRDGLVSLASDLIPDGHAEVVERPHRNDFTFIIGRSAPLGAGSRAWRLGGSRWSGHMTRPNCDVPLWPDDFPIGALAAASAAAAEPFKEIVSSLLKRYGRPERFAELTPCDHAEISLGAERIFTGCDIGNIDVVSAGAITNGALHALLRVPGLVARLRLLEPDRVDLSNLNRYALARRSHVGQLKIEALASWTTSALRISGVPTRVDRTSLPALAPLADTVLVGTDDIPSRWLVQEQRPGWLGVGATAHFQTVTSEHSSKQPCAGCLHPEDDDATAPIPTISFVSYWGGLTLAALLINYVSGAKSVAARQTIEIAALQVGAPRGMWWHRVHRSPRCPVRCQRAETGSACANSI